MQAHVQHNRKDIFSFYAHQNDKNDRVGQRDTAASEIIAPPLIAADLLVSLILAFGNNIPVVLLEASNKKNSHLDHDHTAST